MTNSRIASSPQVDSLGLTPDEVEALVSNPGAVISRSASGSPEVFSLRSSHPINQVTRSDLTPTIRTPDGIPVAQSKVKGPSPDFAYELGRKAIQERLSQEQEDQERLASSKRLQPSAMMARIEFLERSLKRLQKQINTSCSAGSTEG